MVAELSARHALSKQIVDGVTERTGGVPLFIEEVTRLLLERGEQGGSQAIPPTLQQSLMARLDRLGPAREVAQIAAVIGRGFSYGLLRATAGMEDAPLQSALERLAESDLILVQGLPPDSDYRFKHALIQDAAYENLLKSRRTILHRRIAETLRDRFQGIAAAEPEVLAYHFTQAGFDEQAIEWWGKAGDQALHRSAYVETIEHFGKAISMAKVVPATPALRREQIRFQVALITPLIHVKGYAATETKAATEQARLLIEQAEALGEHPEDPLLLFAVLYGFSIANFVGFNGDALGELAAQFLPVDQVCKHASQENQQKHRQRVRHLNQRYDERRWIEARHQPSEAALYIQVPIFETSPQHGEGGAAERLQAELGKSAAVLPEVPVIRCCRIGCSTIRMRVEHPDMCCYVRPLLQSHHLRRNRRPGRGTKAAE
jgi:predicted ATPase